MPCCMYAMLFTGDTRACDMYGLVSLGINYSMAPQQSCMTSCVGNVSSAKLAQAVVQHQESKSQQCICSRSWLHQSYCSRVWQQQLHSIGITACIVRQHLQFVDCCAMQCSLCKPQLQTVVLVFVNTCQPMSLCCCPVTCASTFIIPKEAFWAALHFCLGIVTCTNFALPLPSPLTEQHKPIAPMVAAHHSFALHVYCICKTWNQLGELLKQRHHVHAA